MEDIFIFPVFVAVVGGNKHTVASSVSLPIDACMHVLKHICQVTLDISGSPIGFQWGSRKYSE